MVSANKKTVTLQDIQIELDGEIIGGAQALSVSYTQENTPVHEGGNKKPFEIMDGQITVNGTIEKMIFDKNSITKLINLQTGYNPYFNLIGVSRKPGNALKIKVIDAKFKGFSFDMSLTDATPVTKEFDALDINFA